MEASQLIGKVRTTHELHSFHGDHWLVVKDEVDSVREIESAAHALLKRGEVDGIRVARRIVYEDYDFTTTVVLMKRLMPGVQEVDPLQVANPGRDASWCDKPEDLYGDLQRQVFRAQFAKYLDERRLTPLEVLYSETHAKALDQAGTTVQGALQRLASAQVRGTKQTASARMKELFQLAEEGLRRLNAIAKEGPPVKLAPGGLSKAAHDLEAAGADPVPALFRGIVAHLADAKSWVEKLDRLFRLWEPDLTIREMRVLDSLAAEILASPFALKELAGDSGGRLDMVMRAIDLYSGNLGQGGNAAAQPEGVRALSRLLSEGLLPRSVAEARLGLLRHLYSRLPFKTDAGLRDEVRACVQILDHLRKRAPVLARDEEILEALATKVDRIIQPESVAEVLAKSRTNTAKIETLLSLVEQVPGEAPKLKLAPYLRPLIVPDDLVRESGAASSRAEAIRPVARIARRIEGSGLPASQAKDEMLHILDTALFELIRSDLLGNQSLSFTDRMLHLVKTGSVLPEGRARQLASDTLSQALRRPEFILNYLERFSSTAERRDAYFKLCNDLIECGLVDRALVPTAA